MKTNSKNKVAPAKLPTQELLETRWATETIDPIWHLVAALQNVSARSFNHAKKQTWVLLHRNMIVQQEMREFADHCATIIQSRFRGYRRRKYYALFLPVYRRFRDLLGALVSGWRTRRILKIRSCRNTCEQIKEAARKGQHREARILKRNLLYDIKELEKKGKWLSIYAAERKAQPSKQTLKINIKSALTQASLRSSNRQSSANLGQAQQPPEAAKSLEVKESQERGSEEAIRNGEKRELKGNLRDEMPIKASGKYEICESDASITGSIPKKSKAKSGQALRRKPAAKAQPSDLLNSSNVEPSNLSIQLPVDEEHQEVPILRRPTTVRQINLLPTPKHAPPQEARASQRKGITVTLVRGQEIANREKPKEKPKDGLSMILEVYESTYQEKREEIREKLEAMNTQTKFRGRAA